MKSGENKSNFRVVEKKLLDWYALYKRDLPWRSTRDPYLIWLSEIILQQTRVDQGLSYYYAISSRYPDILSLADSQEEDLLKHWQGLGYYSRARNLLKTAQIIANTRSGIFPSSYEQLLELPGIGPYTAAAIASIAFSEPVPAIDGNVIRVLSRLFGILNPYTLSKSMKVIREVAMHLLNYSDPGTFNQALMEFGALQCIPAHPDCNGCPVRSYCYAFRKDQVDQFPGKKKSVRHIKRNFHYLVIETPDGIVLNRRTGKDIWQGLYEFPLIESGNRCSLKEILNHKIMKSFFKNPEQFSLIRTTGPVSHVLSHQKIQAWFYSIKAKNRFATLHDPYFIASYQVLEKMPFPVLVARFMEQNILPEGK